MDTAARAGGARRVVAIVSVAGSLAVIAGSFGPWAKLGSATLDGIGGASPEDLFLYPELDTIFAPGVVTLVLALLALASLALALSRGPAQLALLSDLCGLGSVAVALISIVEMTSLDAAYGSAQPGWGVIAVLAGGLLTSFAGSLLFVVSLRVR